MVAVAVAVAVAGSEAAALAGAVVSAEVGCEQVDLVAVPCVRLDLTGVGLQAIASRTPVSGAELTSAGPAGVAVVGADVGPAVAGVAAGAEITGAGAQPRSEWAWPMPVAPTVTRTMTTMATAVMDTDHTDHMRRHLDLERIGHLCVHTVPGGGDVISST